MRYWILILSIAMFFMLLISSLTESVNAHELPKKDCATYARIQSVIASPKKPVKRIVRRQYKKCVKAANAHANWHPMQGLPWLLRKIRSCESGSGGVGSYNYSAQNRHSTASGAYQYLDTTWGGHMGYRKARFAPPRIQDRRALRDFRKSTSPWNASKGCWG